MLRLGVNAPFLDGAETVRQAERLGFDIAFVPEGFWSDAVSVLGYLAARTERIHLASGVFQIPARTPAMTVMTTAMLDSLSGGRFRLGLGVTNSRVTQGWHGMPFAKPLARVREYVEIVRAALDGDRVHYQGAHYRIPLPGNEDSGYRLAHPLTSPRIPIYLAALGPRSLELAGEIADGWFGVFCSPERIAESVRRVAAGRQRRACATERFEVMLSIPVVVDDNPERAAEPLRNYVARFVSIGHREQNFYYGLLVEAGFGAAAARIQDLIEAGRVEAAAKVVPLEFIDSVALLGPPDRIAKRMQAYADAGATMLALSPAASDLHTRVEALEIAAAVTIETGKP